MLRTAPLVSLVVRSASRRSVVCSARPLASRPLSVFASGAPPSGESYKKIMQELGNVTTGEEVLDSQVPLGAPKPSALNRLRTSGRGSLEQLEKRRDDAQDKLNKALDYKAKRDAQKKAAEQANGDAAKKA